MLEPLHIVIDTRENTPWAWDPSDAVTEVKALVAGDYALASDCEKPKRKPRRKRQTSSCRSEITKEVK